MAGRTNADKGVEIECFDGRSRADCPAKGEQRVLMLAVRFRDVEPKMSLDQIRERAVIRLNDYVKAQSDAQAWIPPQFIGGVSLPGKGYGIMTFGCRCAVTVSILQAG